MFCLRLLLLGTTFFHDTFELSEVTKQVEIGKNTLCDDGQSADVVASVSGMEKAKYVFNSINALILPMLLLLYARIQHYTMDVWGNDRIAKFE